MKFWKSLLFVISLAGSLWLLGFICFLCFVPFSTPKIILPTDGMVIFTGGQTRLATALTLFYEKKSKYFLISGANPLSPSKDIAGPLADNPYVTVGYQAIDTLGNAEETAAWVQANPIQTLRLITSNYHMPRSLFEIHHLLPRVRIIPHPVIGENFRNKLWWTEFASLTLVVHEYNKLLATLCRYMWRDALKDLIS